MSSKAAYYAIALVMLVAGLSLIWLASYKSYKALGTIGIFLGCYAGVVASKAKDK